MASLRYHPRPVPRQYNGDWMYREFRSLGAAIEDAITASVTYDPANLADGAGVTATVAVPGAVLGDHVDAAFSLNTQGVQVQGRVSAANTVKVRFQNETGAPVNLGSGIVRVRVTKA